MAEDSLGTFNKHHIDHLVNEVGVEMEYDFMPHMGGFKHYGAYYQDFEGIDNLVVINDDLPTKYLEDLTIMHEWLHVYEEVILMQESSDHVVELWAQLYLRLMPELVEYIREKYDEF